MKRNPKSRRLIGPQPSEKFDRRNQINEPLAFGVNIGKAIQKYRYAMHMAQPYRDKLLTLECRLAATKTKSQWTRGALNISIRLLKKDIKKRDAKALKNFRENVKRVCRNPSGSWWQRNVLCHLIAWGRCTIEARRPVAVNTNGEPQDG